MRMTRCKNTTTMSGSEHESIWVGLMRRPASACREAVD